MTCPMTGTDIDVVNGATGPRGGGGAAAPTSVVSACPAATGSGAWPETNDGSGSGSGSGDVLPR